MKRAKDFMGGMKLRRGSYGNGGGQALAGVGDFVRAAVGWKTRRLKPALRLLALLTHHPPDILCFAEKHEDVVAFEAAVRLGDSQGLLNGLLIRSR